LTETILIALMFAVPLGFEWRYQLRSLRLGTAILSLVVFLFAQPNYTSAARRVSGAPPAERITQLRGSLISEYESGVLTMYEALDDVHDASANIRLLSLAVLTWLACSPALRRSQARSIGNEVGRGSRERVANP